jgi:hypothetical protein
LARNLRNYGLFGYLQVIILVLKYSSLLNPNKGQKMIKVNWIGGIIHFSITEPNIEDLVKKVSETGGKQLSKIWEINPEKHHKIAFCADPFGNTIEIYSYSFEEFHANVVSFN